MSRRVRNTTAGPYHFFQLVRERDHSVRRLPDGRRTCRDGSLVVLDVYSESAFVIPKPKIPEFKEAASIAETVRLLAANPEVITLTYYPGLRDTGDNRMPLQWPTPHTAASPNG